MRASFTAWSCGLIGFGSVALGACGGGNFSVPEELHADADAGADASAPVDDPKATVEAGAGDAASQPPPVVPVPPVACDEAPDLANHAFVSATAGVAGTCGPSTAPCKTIAEAIVWAKANGRTKIIVDKGTYTESLTLAKGIFIQGGWAKSDGWKRICDDKERAASVVIEAPVTQTITALAEDLGGTATLDTVNLRSKETAAPGESLYGLVVRGASSKVVLTGVGIVVAPGGAGTNGTPGSTGTMGSASCSAGTGGTPAAGQLGQGASATVFGKSGVTTSIGTAGTTGGAGGNGTSPAGTCNSDCLGGCVLGPCVPNEDPTSTVCGGNGSPGCGGAGGGGGQPGIAGGSSIALFIWDGTVTGDFALFAAGAAGAGGTGGAGGAGGSASAGASGTAASCTGGCLKIGTTCKVVKVTIPSAHGGDGSPGSSGGTGGGGAGGFSYAYFTGGPSASFSVMLAVTQHGAAGAPGQGGTGGAAGGSGDHN